MTINDISNNKIQITADIVQIIDEMENVMDPRG